MQVHHLAPASVAIGPAVAVRNFAWLPVPRSAKVIIVEDSAAVVAGVLDKLGKAIDVWVKKRSKRLFHHFVIVVSVLCYFTLLSNALNSLLK